MNDSPAPDEKPDTFAEEGLPLVSPDFVEQDQADDLDNIVPTRGYQSLPVVGLGGSAGSIPALQRFFGGMTVESGMAFVVVIHLSSEHESILADILGRATAMPVAQAINGQRLQPDHVYVIPPGKHLAVTNGRITLTPMEAEPGRRAAVDVFFRSLADTHGPRAMAVVLSGADGDGAIGIKRIKERGGLTVAQDPEEAEQSSMPRSAIETGMVDWVLKIGEMPERLLRYRANEARLRLPSEEGPQPAAAPAQAEDGDEQALRDVLAFLRTRTGRDFSYYKRATVVRRISRRMQVNSVFTMEEYLAFLRTHPGEAGALLQDLLISVTNFFRDRDAFAALEAQIAALFIGKDVNSAVRVWVPACATGEEAYSIAMLLLEHANGLSSPPTVQVFATDLDEDAVVAARRGVYPLTIQADVSEERLRRFFAQDARGYRVRRELRDCVLFAVHDLLKDSPFSRMDLISCRNLLIYLTREAQARALDIFHFALRAGGRLFLGNSESIDEDNARYVALDKRHRIFEHRSSARADLPGMSAWADPTFPLDLRRPPREAGLVPERRFTATSAEGVHASADLGERQRVSWEELHFRLIERYAPPSLIVTRDYELVHVSENAGRFLRMRGTPSANLLDVVHPMLRVELRAALFRVAQENLPVELFRIPLELEDKMVSVDVRVTPAQEIAPDYLLVVFAVREMAESEAVQARVDAEPAVRHLERENEQLRRRLKNTIEQYEASLEEAKLGHEELQAMNEELRSSGEELESSREEIQSVNEELSTVNLELKGKVEDLARTNSDLSNLMAASGVATIFLDRTLRIKRYTPAAVELFRLIPTDLERPLTDLTHGLNYPELKDDFDEVLRKLTPRSREVCTADGRWFLAQLLPYRSEEDQIRGVVLSFVDITKARQAGQALQVSEERLRLIVENAREYAIFSLDLDRRIQSWNAGAHAILGYSLEEALGQSADIIFTEEDRAAGAPEEEASKALAEGRAADERWHVCKDGERFWGSGVMMAMRDARGEAIGLVKVFRDHTAELRAKEALEASRTELWQALQETEQARAEAEAAGKAKDHFLAVLSHELRTPLTPVIVAVRTIARDKTLPQKTLDALAMIQRNVQMEARFIDDLLDVTRIGRGEIELVREPVDLHQVIAHAMEVALPDLEAKGQRITAELGASNSHLMGDAKRLQQVFWNLLKNASKFSPEAGEITLVSRDQPGQIVVEVRDTGIGFEPEAGERIFNPFEQASQEVSRKFGGLGLGLAITKAAVEAHGGTIRAESPGPGSGATFTVTLPL